MATSQAQPGKALNHMVAKILLVDDSNTTLLMEETPASHSRNRLILLHELWEGINHGITGQPDGTRSGEHESRRACSKDLELNTVAAGNGP